MRYNPETDRARDIDNVAEQCRQAIEGLVGDFAIAPDDVFAAEACLVWNVCQRLALRRNDRVAIGRIEAYLQRDMAVAMHYRPHQPEF